MLAFAAVVPHPLISIPEIGKQYVSKLRKTYRAFKVLGSELYSAKPDILVVISPHTSQHSGLFAVNQRPQLTIDFEKFGNLSDRFTMQNDIAFGYRIKESLETNLPIALSDDEVLDYGSAIPLFHLTAHLNRETVRVVPIGTSDLGYEIHYAFGTAINRLINTTTKRVAVVASGDLSHGVSKNGPTPYKKEAKAFNAFIKTALEKNDVQSLTGLSSDMYKDSEGCIIRPLNTLLGVLGDRSYTFDIIADETVLGIGYLTAQVHFS